VSEAERLADLVMCRLCNPAAKLEMIAAAFAAERARAIAETGKALDTLTRERDALRAALARLEWIVEDDEDVDTSSYGFCPGCGRERREGHDAPCWLAALLAPEPAP
jgi:hypothetical protein